MTDAAAEVAALLDRARARLHGIPQVTLGERRQPRRILGVPRAPRIAPVGTAWHLGVLLLTEEAVLATGEVVRARAEAIRGFTAESQRARAELAAAASRGGFDEGAVVHIGWVPLDLPELSERTSPLAVRDGVPSVRWSAAGGYVPLTTYLDERVELLRRPPERA